VTPEDARLKVLARRAAETRLAQPQVAEPGGLHDLKREGDRVTQAALVQEARAVGRLQ
jgi:hypothetical protein